jgi:hypothetical protein
MQAHLLGETSYIESAVSDTTTPYIRPDRTTSREFSSRGHSFGLCCRRRLEGTISSSVPSDPGLHQCVPKGCALYRYLCISSSTLPLAVRSQNITALTQFKSQLGLKLTFAPIPGRLLPYALIASTLRTCHNEPGDEVLQGVVRHLSGSDTCALRSIAGVAKRCTFACSSLRRIFVHRCDSSIG